MQIRFAFLLVVFIMSSQLYGQRNTETVPGQKISYAGSDQTGTVKMLVTGIGKNKKETAEAAMLRALETLLFQGLPGSTYSTPLLSNLAQQKEHPAVKALLKNGLSDFVMNSSLQGEEKLNRKKDGAKGLLHTYLLTINYEALRRHLENEGVIRKFGI